MLPAMRRLALTTALAATLLAGGCPRPAPAVGVSPPGATAADLALTRLEAAADLDGAVVGPLPAGGRATVAVVFASWCSHCRAELPILAELGRLHPDVRIVGVNYRGHEEYEQRGDAAAVRAFVAERAPWLRVVPADEALWSALGRPPKVPTLYVFDRDGRRWRTFDRRRDDLPDLATLEAALPPP